MLKRAPVLVLLIGGFAAAASCDDKSNIRGMPLESAGKRLLQFRTVTQLSPNRPTHVTLNRLGHIFWVQESEDGQDVLFMTAETSIPRATRLNTANIMQALSEAGDTSGSGKEVGNIRALVAAEGGIYFYFYGLRGNSPKACLGQYLPQAAQIRILADTKRLEGLAKMGRSLDLARATMIVTGERVWLWLRHSDGSVFLVLDPRFIPPVGTPNIEVPMERIVSEGSPLALNNDEHELSAGPNGTLLLMDFSKQLLWQVEPTGAATPRFSLTGYPRALSPAATASNDRLLIFAAESEPIGSELEIVSRTDLPHFTYPALLEFKDPNVSAIQRDEFRAHSGFPVYQVRLSRLIPETPDSYISYDSNSGALMRLKIVETD